MRPNQQRTLALILLVTLLGVFLVILLTTVITYFFTRRLNAPDTTADLFKTLDQPHTILTAAEVDPALALISLGGVSEHEVILDAIQKSRPETALSLLLFTPFLADRERAEQYVALGQSYGRAKTINKAVFSYYQAGQIAIISPDIPDSMRADILLQTSEGFMAVDNRELAHFYLDQAFTLASGSPFLSTIQRRDIFQRAEKIYTRLEDAVSARKSLGLSANPPDITAVTEYATLLPIPQPYTSTASEAESARWLAAQQLAALLVEHGGKVSQDAYIPLHDALIKEDAEKLTLLEKQLADAPQISNKINVLAAEVAWLSIKYRVAKKGYGFSLVSEWETNESIGEIEGQLNQRYTRLFALYGELIVALPEISQINQATQEALRREILVGELAQYPNYPKAARQQQLSEIVNQLSATQPELRIFLEQGIIAKRTMYILKEKN